MVRQIDTPAGPPGWEGRGAQLIRIVDPLGGAVAWLAPDCGANCVGYAVRRPGGGWVQVFHVAGPRALRERPDRSGCPVLAPFPGLLPRARYRWAGATYALPPNTPGGAGTLHGFAHTRPWRFVERDPTAATVELATATDLDADARAGYPFDLRLRLTARLADAALTLDLAATNEGDRAAPVGLGLQPYFAVDPLGGDRARVRACLAGRAERLLSPPLPTGGLRPIASPVVAVPPVAGKVLIARTDLGDDPRAHLVGPDGGGRVVLTAVAGVRDLLLFAPPGQPAIALSPLSCAPSAAALPEGDPDGLPALPPGATLRLAVTIAALPDEPPGPEPRSEDCGGGG